MLLKNAQWTNCRAYSGIINWSFNTYKHYFTNRGAGLVLKKMDSPKKWGLEPCFGAAAADSLDQGIIWSSAPRTPDCSSHAQLHTAIAQSTSYSAYPSPLLLRGAPDYSIDTVSGLICRGASE